MATKELINVSEEVFNEASNAWVDASTQITQLEAKKAQSIAKVEQQYKDRLDELHTQKLDAESTIQFYAESNRETLLKEAKSKKLGAITIGFRSSAKKLQLLKNMEWEKVLERLVNHFPQYVKTKSEIDKKAIVNSETLDAKDLKKMGVEIAQSESFFVKL